MNQRVNYSTILRGKTFGGAKMRLSDLRTLYQMSSIVVATSCCVAARGISASCPGSIEPLKWPQPKLYRKCIDYAQILDLNMSTFKMSSNKYASKSGQISS
ncbi:hypothetical protein XENOCAPTIV_018819 [Xenoophorus captivus]|uniref:Uncharacterized protein n=1 Tax=Xenoophorus captivus TaxID=1517983 RepID=A0ABV0RTB9_9TELE